jgi:leader peptidase (prepilin peptidase)/N-methyltransferase
MPWELVPIFSFLFLGRKCSKCKQKISWFYPLFEMSSGLLFMISFLIFGFSYELIIALTFISLTSFTSSIYLTSLVLLCLYVEQLKQYVEPSSYCERASELPQSSQGR